MASDKLETILRDRDIPLGKDDVSWAFENQKTRHEAESWMKEYLALSTLLNKDELSFYERHGIDSLDVDTHSGRALSDAELEKAIEALEASTAAIEKQTTILQNQKDALKELQSQNAAEESVRSARERRQTKLARERAQIDLDIDEVMAATTSRLRSTQKQSEGVKSLLPSQTERLLEKDDRLLAGLTKLLPRIADTASDTDDSADVEQLCSALTALTIEEIHARMDRVYRESIAKYSHQSNGSSGTGLSDLQIKQREAARSELQELEREVEGLVAIVVDQQHRKPLKKGLLSSRANSQLQRTQWSEYAVTALLYLASRLDAIADHIEHVHAHTNTLHAVSEALEETTAVQSASGKATTSSVSAEKSAGKGLIPLRLVQENRSEPQDPAVHLLRQLDIRVPENSTMTKLAETLESALRERKKRLAHLSDSTEDITTGSIAQSLTQADVDLRHVLEAVYENSRYGTVHLVDADVQTKMDELEKRTQSLGNQMRELDVDAIARTVKTKQAEIARQLNA